MLHDALLYILVGFVIGSVLTLFCGAFRSWEMHGKQETFSKHFNNFIERH